MRVESVRSYPLDDRTLLRCKGWSLIWTKSRGRVAAEWAGVKYMISLTQKLKKAGITGILPSNRMLSSHLENRYAPAMSAVE